MYRPWCGSKAAGRTLPFHFNLFWQSLHVTVPAPLFFSKCFRTDDDLADDSSIAKTGFSFFISGCFAHALVARIIRIMKRSSNIDGRILLFEYSIYSFHPYFLLSSWESSLTQHLYIGFLQKERRQMWVHQSDFMIIERKTERDRERVGVREGEREGQRR